MNLEDLLRFQDYENSDYGLGILAVLHTWASKLTKLAEGNLPIWKRWYCKITAFLGRDRRPSEKIWEIPKKARESYNFVLDICAKIGKIGHIGKRVFIMVYEK